MRRPYPPSDEHGEALDPGAECRHPDARPNDCARTARYRVNRVWHAAGSVASTFILGTGEEKATLGAWV